jgi:hypothetical protein
MMRPDDSSETLDRVPQPEHGSQHDLLQWVTHHQADLNRRLLDESHTLREFARGGTIEWLAPNTATGKELKDGARAAVGLAPSSPQAAGWWPAGGPTWDGVARVRGDGGEVGALFVEAKGHAAELRGGGCKSANADNRQKITDGLSIVKARLGVLPQMDWLGPPPSSTMRSAPARARAGDGELLHAGEVIGRMWRRPAAIAATRASRCCSGRLTRRHTSAPELFALAPTRRRRLQIADRAEGSGRFGPSDPESRRSEAL